MRFLNFCSSLKFTSSLGTWKIFLIKNIRFMRLMIMKEMIMYDRVTVLFLYTGLYVFSF